MTSESTLRFRSRSESVETLSQAQFTVESVRDAPDRPGLEFVFIAHRWYQQDYETRQREPSGSWAYPSSRFWAVPPLVLARWERV